MQPQSSCSYPTVNMLLSVQNFIHTVCVGKIHCTCILHTGG